VEVSTGDIRTRERSHRFQLCWNPQRFNTSTSTPTSLCYGHLTRTKLTISLCGITGGVRIEIFRSSSTSPRRSKTRSKMRALSATLLLPTTHFPPNLYSKTLLFNSTKIISTRSSSMANSHSTKTHIEEMGRTKNPRDR
jgi:hypothetical protein